MVVPIIIKMAPMQVSRETRGAIAGEAVFFIAEILDFFVIRFAFLRQWFRGYTQRDSQEQPLGFLELGLEEGLG